jgi:hypothetical protein
MTDFLTEIGDAYMVRAYVERVAECPSAARTAMETARGAYEGKGDAVMVSKVDELLARLTPPMSPATG